MEYLEESTCSGDNGMEMASLITTCHTHQSSYDSRKHYMTVISGLALHIYSIKSKKGDINEDFRRTGWHIISIFWVHKPFKTAISNKKIKVVSQITYAEEQLPL